MVELVNDPGSDLEPGHRVVLDAVRRCGRCHDLAGRTICARRCASRDGPAASSASAAASANSRSCGRPRPWRLSNGVGFEEASLVEPLACCLHSIRKAQLEPGETAIILGAGTMGGMHIRLAKLMGARVIATDLDPARLAFARHVVPTRPWTASRADLVEVVKDRTAGRGADAVFVTAGSGPAGEQALAMAGPMGRVVFYASTQPSFPLRMDWNRLHYGESVITGSAGKTAADFVDAASLLEHGRIDLGSFVSRVISLAELPAELAATPAGRDASRGGPA